MLSSNEIITRILAEYKKKSANNPTNPSIVSNTNGDSFYLIRQNENRTPVQIRLSNHGTYLRTWCDREELGGSMDRIDPFISTNISIVFVDEMKKHENGMEIERGLTDDCYTLKRDANGQTKKVFQKNCNDCQISPCIPQTFKGQNEIGRPFTVKQYVYQSKDISLKYIKGLAKAIVEASVSGIYRDPFRCNVPRLSTAV